MDTENTSQPTNEQPSELDPTIFYSDSSESVVSDTETEDLPEQTTDVEESDTDDTDEHDETTGCKEELESDTIDVFEIDGKEYTADQIQELEKGYERQRDYTKKTQEVAEKRKEADQIISVLGESVTRLEATLTEFEKDIVEAEKQLNDDLLDEDSSEYIRLERKIAKQRKRLNDGVEQLNQAKQQHNQAEKLEQAKLFNKKFPDLQDPDKREKRFDKWESALAKLDIPMESANKQGYEFYVLLDALCEQNKQVASNKRVKKVTKVSKSVKKNEPKPVNKSAAQIFYGN